MNTSNMTYAASTPSLRRGIPVVGILLISAVVGLGLAGRLTSAVAPATAPSANLSAARERFAALKQAQAEQVMDSAMALPPVSLSRWERYVAFKDAQAEQHDTTVVPVPPNPTGRERFATMKELQAEMREAGIH